jgi:intracellular sulfur oxidation DsrE/DsrF family protein
MLKLEKTIHIDIPVKLPEVKVVFSLASLSFEGDLPGFLLAILQIGKPTPKSSQSSPTNAGHVTLHDTAYNADRNITSGDPYKGLVADLIKRGVKVELCGATATVHGWGNADLLADIRINRDAMARTTQLVQEGFVKISES